MPTYCGSTITTAGINSYSVEYLSNLPLSDRFVFGEYQSNDWPTIFSSLRQMLGEFKKSSLITDQSYLKLNNELLQEKSLKRIEQYYNQINNQVSIVDAYEHKKTKKIFSEILENSDLSLGQTTENELSIIHGDYCFSNIIFDPRTSSSKCYDPRGENFNGDKTIYGDVRYDLAKLYHSAYGYYDLLVSNRFSGATKEASTPEFKQYSSVIADIEEYLLKPLSVDFRELKIIVLHLFISMLPLHFDDINRQQRLIKNIERIYKDVR